MLNTTGDIMNIREITEGYWKNLDIERQEAASKKKRPEVIKDVLPKYVILINGKIWKKEGKPVEFNNLESAKKSANTIKNRYLKTTQIVPV